MSKESSLPVGNTPDSYIVTAKKALGSLSTQKKLTEEKPLEAFPCLSSDRVFHNRYTL